MSSIFFKRELVRVLAQWDLKEIISHTIARTPPIKVRGIFIRVDGIN
jgi:hypothetical protein